MRASMVYLEAMWCCDRFGPIWPIRQSIAVVWQNFWAIPSSVTTHALNLKTRLQLTWSVTRVMEQALYREGRPCFDGSNSHARLEQS